MDLTSIKIIKNLSQEYGLHPSRSNGQNFLIDKNIIDKIVAAGELKVDDVILEIGPGFGVLTQELVKQVSLVLVVEKDKRLGEFLIKNKKQITKNKNNLEIINEDVLKINLEKIDGIPAFAGMTFSYKIISNLPYQITSPVLWKFLHEDNLSSGLSLLRRGELEIMVLMVQKEVGQRICAKPGKMSILSVLCQIYADCEIVAPVSRNCFWPTPEVDSVVVKLKIKKSTPLTSFSKEASLDKNLMRLVKIGFSAKRKMLKNNLAGGLKISTTEVVKILKEIGLNEKVRAQDLNVEDWKKICQVFLNLKLLF